MTTPTLAPFVARGQRLQATLTAQTEAGDREGSIETMEKMVELMETIVFLGILPCIACHGDLTDGTTHYSWHDATWRCLPEREVDS